MKKTLTISISGFVFHIEEDAYDKLDRYLEAIKSHFRGFEGKEEVISDVEARIAELLQKKISDSKEVITIDDIGEVVAILGQPADFAMDDEPAGSTYEPSYARMPKRLYRDPERKMIGGVCSGLSAYFNLDPVWVRVIFIFSIMISGFGLLVYLILWLVVPEARTTAERLEMKGEPVNISNIEKSIDEELHQIENKLSNFTSKAKATYRTQKEQFNSNHRDQFLDSLGEVGRVLLRILLIFLGIVILLVGIALTIAYLSILFRFPVVAMLDEAGMHVFPLYSVIEKIFGNDSDLHTFATGMLVLAGIPLLMLLWAGIRLIFNLPRARFINGIAGLVWLCALVITLVFGFKVASSFRGTGEFARENILKIKSTDTLIVISNGLLPLEENWERSGMFYFPEARLAVRNDTAVLYGIPLLKFKTSTDSTGHIIVTTNARGISTSNAIENAERVDYQWQQNNDTLLLSDHFTLPADEKWRKQETRIEVQLPEGTTVKIDKNIYPFLGYHKNISRHDRIGTLFIMNNEGLVRTKSEE